MKQAQRELNRGVAFGSTTNPGNDPRSGLTVDGDFGADTLAATTASQRAVHLSVDGEIGNDTWTELDHCLTITTFC